MIYAFPIVYQICLSVQSTWLYLLGTGLILFSVDKVRNILQPWPICKNFSLYINADRVLHV